MIIITNIFSIIKINTKFVEFQNKDSVKETVKNMFSDIFHHIKDESIEIFKNVYNNDNKIEK